MNNESEQSAGVLATHDLSEYVDMQHANIRAVEVVGSIYLELLKDRTTAAAIREPVETKFHELLSRL